MRNEGFSFPGTLSGLPGIHLPSTLSTPPLPPQKQSARARCGSEGQSIRSVTWRSVLAQEDGGTPQHSLTTCCLLSTPSCPGAGQGQDKDQLKVRQRTTKVYFKFLCKTSQMSKKFSYHSILILYYYTILQHYHPTIRLHHIILDYYITHSRVQYSRVKYKIVQYSWVQNSRIQ